MKFGALASGVQACVLVALCASCHWIARYDSADVDTSWCSAEGWCLAYPNPTHYQALNAIWRSPSGKVFAVGAAGTVLQSDGQRWRRRDTSISVELYGIWGRDDDDIYAVGQSGALLHYDGTSWQPVSLGIEAKYAFRAIRGTPDGQLFIVGDQATVIHFDGSTWRKLELPPDLLLGSSSSVRFSALWASETGEMFIAGDRGLIVAYRGGAWRVLAAGGASLRAIWGRQDEIFAAGDWGTLLHCADGRCSALDTGVSDALMAITPAAEGPDLLVVGRYGAALRYDGTSCVRETNDFSGYELRGVTASAPPLAVGTAGYVLERKGDRWIRVHGGLEQIAQLWALDQQNIYALAHSNDILSSMQVLHFDGKRWQVMLELQPRANLFFARLNSVWASAADDVFVVGLFGIIEHYDGQRWSSMATDLQTMLFFVWGTGPQDVYAVGQSSQNVGTILRFDGNRWSRMQTPADMPPLKGIWGTSDRLFAVGRHGVIVELDRKDAGDGWQWAARGGPDLAAVWGSSAENVYAVGQSGTVLRYDGTVWQSEFSGATGNLEAVWGTGAADIYVVGQRDSRHFDGQTWSDVNVGFSLRKLTGASDPDGGVTLYGVVSAGYNDSAGVVVSP
jgi:hypothetical protein